MKVLSEIRHAPVVPAVALFAEILHQLSYFRRNVPENEVLSRPPGFLFGNARATLMPRERSFDIDTAMDFIHAEVLLAEARQT